MIGHGNLNRVGMAALVFMCVAGVGSVAAQPNSTGSSPGQPSSQVSTPATSTTGAAGQTQQAGQGNTLDPNRRVCRRQETLGSRLRARSVCRTAAEWDAMDRRARENAKDLTNRSNINSTQPKMGGG